MCRKLSFQDKKKIIHKLVTIHEVCMPLVGCLGLK